MTDPIIDPSLSLHPRSNVFHDFEMAKPKRITSLAEEQKARKLREEAEKNACLPPGLVNNTNTCFFNSVLQAVSIPVFRFELPTQLAGVTDFLRPN